MSDAVDRPIPIPGESWSERAALGLGAAINETRPGRAMQDVFLRGFGYVWMRAVLSSHALVDGLEAFRRLDPDRGVMLVCNHRSFFDLYAVSVGFFAGPSPWVERLSFPVKGDFFYERPLGMFTNLIAGAGVMYPPFFRQRHKARRNRESLRTLEAFLQQSGSLVGFHPEGKRSKSDDPYALLPMQPGAGEIALRSGAIVVPVFINGLGNSLTSEIRRRFSTAARNDPCICVFGEPLDLSAFAAMKPGPAAYKRAADRMGDAITLLGERERALRIAAPDLARDDPRWLENRPVSRFYAFRGKRPNN